MSQVFVLLSKAASQLLFNVLAKLSIGVKVYFYIFIFFFLPSSVMSSIWPLWHISLLRHQTWVLASQRCWLLYMAGLVLPEAYLQDQFVQITPFTHIVKTLQFLLVEMCQKIPSHISKTQCQTLLQFMRLKKSWCWLGSNNFPLRWKFLMHMFYHLS